MLCDYCNSVLVCIGLCAAATVCAEFCCSFDFWFEALWSHYTCPDGFTLASIPAAQYTQAVYDHVRCLRGSAPAYLADYCTSASSVPGWSALRSAAHGDIVIPSHRTDWGLRSFSVADPSCWNALPVGLRSSSLGLDTFAKHLKHIYLV